MASFSRRRERRDDEILFPFEKTPRISFSCKLVSVKYREYDYGLFGICRCMNMSLFISLVFI